MFPKSYFFGYTAQSAEAVEKKNTPPSNLIEYHIIAVTPRFTLAQSGST